MVKTQYLQRKEVEYLQATEVFEHLPPPSQVKVALVSEGPKFMYVHAERPSTGVIPKFLEGFDVKKYVPPLMPRKIDEKKLSPAEIAAQARAKRKESLFQKGSGAKVLPMIQSKSLEELKRQPATQSSIHDMLSSSEHPLAARGFSEIEDEQKV